MDHLHNKHNRGDAAWSVVVGMIPLLIAIALGYVQAVETQEETAYFQANTLIERMQRAGSDVGAGFRMIRAAQPFVACSDRHLDALRRADMASSLVETFAYRQDGKVICSSLGRDGQAQSQLGPPDYTTQGVDIWTNRSLDFAPGTPFLIVANKEHLGVINKDLVLGSLAGSGIAAASIVNPVNGHLIMSTGQAVAGLYQAGAKHKGRAFRYNGQIVGVARSRHIDAVAIAALSAEQTSSRMLRSLQTSAPIGLLAGLLIGGLFYRSLRMRNPVEAELKSALSRRAFTLHYQPVVDIATGRWIGAEALLRWIGVDGRSVPPDVFLSNAQTFGLMDAMTNEMISLLSKDIEALSSNIPDDFYFSFNLSAADMANDSIVDRLRELKTTSQKRGVRLVAEITEQGRIDHAASYENIKNIQNSGIKIAIDDFGTGYSSLSYINSFDVDIIKIDRSFIMSLGKNQAAIQLIPHIVDIAHNLGISVIAEGIENAEQAEILARHGVSQGQGWYFAKAMPIDEFIRLMPEFAEAKDQHAKLETSA